MPPLNLSPLPSLRTNDESETLLMEREGFVDEEAVAALRAAQHPTPRNSACLDDLALAADDMDFAGWRLSKAVPTRGPEVPPQVIAAIVRRATPPVPVEQGLDAPHQGNHRWWLAATAGILSAIMISTLLLFLSARPGWRLEKIVSPRILTGGRPAAVKVPEPVVSPELTEASPRP